MDLQLPSPASRDLCEDCARYNWVYHLTRYLPNERKDVLYQYEDSLVKKALEDKVIDYDEAHEEWQHEHDWQPEWREMTKWYRINHTPYAGSFFVDEANARTVLKLESRSISAGSEVACSFCELLSRVDQAADVPLPLSTNMICSFTRPNGWDYDPSIFRIYFREGKLKRVYPCGFDLCLLEGEEMELVSRVALNPFQFDLDNLRRWYEDCKAEHQTNCWPARLEPRQGTSFQSFQLTDFRVIDVYIDRVIAAPSDCEYVALSYVWGGAVPSTLKRADLAYDPPQSRTFESSYTTLDRDPLPRTIQDAMFVVAAIGERYLWVDCLCIVQDDAEELKRNIHSMDRIFLAASLTIVAASGNNANCGLPGLYPRSRELRLVTGTIERIELSQQESNVTVDNTDWNDRAWCVTYLSWVLCNNR